MTTWQKFVLDPSLVDAAYANQPIHSRAVYDAMKAEVARLETLLLEETVCGASRCPKCERVIDRKDLVTDANGDDRACWLCERA